MFIKQKTLVGILLAVMLFSNLFSFSKKPEKLPEVSLDTFCETNNKFGFKVFKEIVKEQTDDNIFISPMSISYALGMTFNGADGKTKEEMAKTLEFGKMTDSEINASFKTLMKKLMELDPKVMMEIANSIWYRENVDVLDKFKKVNQDYFQAEIRNMDFSKPETIEIINNWVSENTKGKIIRVIDEIDALSMMYLINAIYFKGSWTDEFKKDRTKQDKFIISEEEAILCDMMKTSEKNLYYENDDFQAIDLPYGNENFSMIIILPKKDKDINEFISNLNAEDWNSWLSKFSKQSGSLYLPKFKIEYELEMNDVLKSLGMPNAFTDAADFSKMTKEQRLFISNVKHKTFVHVNEEGTEAAAVTVVEMKLTSFGPGFFMKVNRPFVFAIKEKETNSILFIGKIVNPKLEK
ncbi:MAG: serpin family protein [Candidatus Tenebribacter davisii]|nr:serpin family protein [Candidatus Tenebribacter davisii]